MISSDFLKNPKNSKKTEFGGRERPSAAEKGRERQRTAEKGRESPAEKGRERQRKAEKGRERQRKPEVDEKDSFSIFTNNTLESSVFGQIWKKLIII